MLKGQYIFSIILIGLLASCDSDINTEEDQPLQKLHFNLQQDSTYQYNIKNDISIEQEIKEKAITIKQNLALSSTLKVLSNNNNSLKLNASYDRITTSTGNDLFSIEFDSDNDDGTNSIYENLRQLVGNTIQINVSNSGSIVSKHSSSINNNTNNNQYSFNDSAIQKVLLQAINIYPQKAVSVGDSWQKKINMVIGFANITAKNVYQLTSIIDTIAHVEMRGRLSSSSNNTKTKASNTDLTGMQTGSYDINIKTGLVVSGKITQDLSGNISLKEITPVDISSKVYIIGHSKWFSKLNVIENHFIAT